MTDDSGAAPCDPGAIEPTAGRPLVTDSWPEAATPEGTRVRVIKDPAWDGPWREVFEGCVDDVIKPYPVEHGRAFPDELEYLVAFDVAQFDASGDGPYRKAVIWDRYIEVL